MNNITSIRVTNKVISDRCVLFCLFKRIVTFYYNLLSKPHNIFKNKNYLPISNIEQKNCLNFLKAAVDTNIDYIY